VFQLHKFSGPLPLSEFIGKYGKIQPGFAERIIKMAEKEQEKRINLNKNIIQNKHVIEIKELNTLKWGYLVSFISVILIVNLCVYGFYLGYPNQTPIIATAIIVAFAGVYLRATKINRKINRNISDNTE
jgi:uncharacterized membrane protein